MKKIRVVVDLCGGVVQGVEVEQGSDVELDVVFLGELDDTSGHVNEEVEVESGFHKNKYIYSTAQSTQAEVERVDNVFKAADKYKAGKFGPTVKYVIGIKCGDEYVMMYSPADSINDMLHISPIDGRSVILRFPGCEIMYIRNPENTKWVKY